jgi:hypothetical protein
MAPSVDVVEVEGRTAERWLYRGCDGADMFPSMDEVEGGTLEYWPYKVCDGDGMAPSVEKVVVEGGTVVEYCLY